MESRGKQGGPLLLPYFALTFAWTWLMWGAAVAAGLSADESPGALLYLLGVFGPLVGTAWTVRSCDSTYRRAFLKRIWDPRRVPAVWWLALVAVTGGPAVLGAVVAATAGTASELSDYGLGSVGAIIVIALIAGLAEEPGWRGAASDSWQVRTHPVWAALGIGVFWSLWHLPLHFLNGSWYHDIGFGSVRFWLVHLLLVQLGVLYVWLANGSGNSILIAILAHAGFNVAAGLVPSSTTRDVVAFVVVTIVTVVVIAATKGGLAFDRPTTNARATAHVGSVATRHL